MPFDPPLLKALVVVVLLVLVLRSLRSAGGSDAVDALLAVIAALAALTPLMNVPFDSDSPVLRVGFARYDAFADWNHPFLSYLLNVPARWSVEPMATRVVPLCWALAETVLLLGVTSRVAGNRAAAFAVTLFVLELRKRHGVYDLSDWDLAGCTLLLAVGWLHGRDALNHAGDAALSAAALVLVAGAASYLAIVSSAVLVAVLAAEARTRVAARWAALAAFAALGLSLLPLREAIRVGKLATDANVAVAQPTEAWASVPQWTLLITEMLQELPTRRTLWTLAPILLGGLWLITRSAQPWARQVLGVLVGVPIAVAMLDYVAHANGGYYIGLMTPLLALAAGGGVAWAVSWLHERLRDGVFVLCSFMIVPGNPSRDELGRPFARHEGMVQVVRVLKDDREAHVVANAVSVGALIAWERARLGIEELDHYVRTGAPAGGQFVLTDYVSCEQRLPCAAMARRGLVVGRTEAVAAAEREAMARLTVGCTPFVDPAQRAELAFFDCRGATTPAGTPPSSPPEPASPPG